MYVCFIFYFFLLIYIRYTREPAVPKRQLLKVGSLNSSSSQAYYNILLSNDYVERSSLLSLRQNWSIKSSSDQTKTNLERKKINRIKRLRFSFQPKKTLNNQVLYIFTYIYIYYKRPQSQDCCTYSIIHIYIMKSKMKSLKRPNVKLYKDRV